MKTAYNNSKGLYDKIYSELRTSDFQDFLNNSGKTASSIKSMIILYRNMDKYAYQEDIIEKKYATDIKRSKLSSKSTRKPFTHAQIEYLWNIQPTDKKEEFVRDFLLLANYTGCRAEELLFIYTANIHLDKNYFIGGIKSEAGTDREIPIHPLIKPIIEKYYNKKNEFLFMKENKKRVFYADYNDYFNLYFIKKHEILKGKTAHCGRHSLRTAFKDIGIKDVIANSILGHSNGSVGKDTYTDVSLEEKIEAIKLVTYKTGKIYVLDANRKTS